MARQPLGIVRPLGDDIAYRVTGVRTTTKRRKRRKHKKPTKIAKFVSHKIDYLIHKEGYEPLQAVAVAYELARRKYGARGELRRPR